MVGLRHEPPRRPAAADERLFMRRCLAHPLKVGAVLPSSQFLGRLVAKHTRRGPDEAVVELGTATTELLALEIPANKLFGIEIDGDLRRFPCREAPQDQLIHGDATRLEALLPPATIGKVRTVTSGIPMVTLPLELQRKMISAWFEVTPPDGRMLTYTYSLVSLVPEAKHGLKGKRCGIEVRKIPPAWVWSYVKVGAGTVSAPRRMTLAA